MKSNPLEIAEIFKLNLNFRVGADHRRRWLAVIEELTNYTRSELVKEAKEVISEVGKEKSRLYYLEAVRRRLMIKANDSRKRECMPKAIKELFK